MSLYKALQCTAITWKLQSLTVNWQIMWLWCRLMTIQDVYSAHNLFLNDPTWRLWRLRLDFTWKTDRSNCSLVWMSGERGYTHLMKNGRGLHKWVWPLDWLESIDLHLVCCDVLNMVSNWRLTQSKVLLLIITHFSLNMKIVVILILCFTVLLRS